MPTTSNFGWTTPADTDLVKDGAAAIRTLGNGIDTSFLDLKGGTTDQVLAKNSNSDLDFKWVAQDDSNAIQNAIVDAKGDLISATAADTPARLAVGANGTVLTADSAEATGLKWATPASGMSLIANTTLGSTATSITFSTISGSYKDLMILFTGRNDSTGTNGTRLRITFNADTGNNYWTVGGGRAGTAGETMNLSIEGNGIAYVDFSGYIANSAAATQYTSAVQMIIPRYSATTLKKAISANGSNVVDASNITAKVLTGYWNSTSAITEITITASAGNFIAGTSASLYGLG